jgi:hypothetical protein
MAQQQPQQPPPQPQPQPQQQQQPVITDGRYKQAFGSMGNQIIGSLWDYMQAPENKARLVNILDPLIQHIIKSIFPYIAFSAILFVLLLVITVLTLVVTLKATGYNPVASLVSALPVLEAVTAAIPAAAVATA